MRSMMKLGIRRFEIPRAVLVLAILLGSCQWNPAFADGDINKVNHVIVLMQGGHSFDNYFGALPYAPGSPYHNGNGACDPNDHSCVDGLTCTQDAVGNLNCSNQNVAVDGSIAFSFHQSQRCVAPANDPSWYYTHLELNFRHPDRTSMPRNNGFLLASSLTQLIGGIPSSPDVWAMAFYDQNELPFYYDLAQKFAIEDTYFASVAGPSFPNHSYLLAATSFGHLTTNDRFPPPGGYKPITGTIFDLLNANGISWANYFQDVPQGGSFLPFNQTFADPHFLPLATFLTEAAGAAGAEPLPQVSFLDPNFGLADQGSENDERPPTDIQRGQAFVSKALTAIRSGPYWRDSVIFIMYDQHGGFYDHALPPPAPQGGAQNPDGLPPGQCADLSDPPLSRTPGLGAECMLNPFTANDSTVVEAESLCDMLAVDPTGPYPPWCMNFDHLGLRVPLLIVSPFSKPHYVGHTIGDHTSILAFIEKRFLSGAGGGSLYLTARDQNASALGNLFDFDNSPSLNTTITQAQGPVNDCTFSGTVTQLPQQHRVLLAWNHNPSPTLAAYSVYRSNISGGPYSLVGSVPASITSYSDATVVSGDTYYYVLTSVDSQGYESAYSNEVGAAIPNR
jgi:phospholipase C